MKIKFINTAIHFNFTKLFLILILLFSIFCSKKEAPKQEEKSFNYKKAAEKDSDESELVDGYALKTSNKNISEKSADITSTPPPGYEDIDFSPKKTPPIKPLDIISESSKLRQIEYKVNLLVKVKNALETREKFLQVLKPNSILKYSGTSFNDFETYQVEVLTPVGKLYETLLEISKLGKIETENVSTEDLTEYFEEQKIKTERENSRSKRRSSAATEGSAQVKNWKDREDLLALSEDNLDKAKLETWKVKDRISWAKVSINFQGKELNDSFQIPNFYNAFVSAVNFIFSIAYGIVYLSIFIIGIYIIYRIYKFFKK